MTRGKRIHRILLADEHMLFRRGLKALVTAETDLEIVGEAASANETLALAKLLTPAAIVVDLDLLTGADEQAPLAFRQLAATTGLLFLAEKDSPELLEKALSAGARGFMLKSTPPAQLIMGLRQVALRDENPRGLSLITSDLKALAASSSFPRPSVLTLREQEVMRLLAEGRTVREVASELALSIKTIEAHKLNLMRKLDIHNRTSLIECAGRMGLLAPVQSEVTS